MQVANAEMGCGSSLSACRSIRRGNNSPCAVLKGHEGSINAMAISVDGSLLATASEDSSCRVWDTETYTVLSEMRGHRQYVSCIAMSAEHVVTASADKTIRKWDILSGDCLYTFTGHQSVINNLLIHGNLLFSTSYDKTARQWDLDTGECLKEYIGHTRGVNPLILVDLSLQDMRPARRVSRTRLQRLSSMQDSPSGSCTSRSLIHNHRVLLITGSADNTARAWPVATNSLSSTKVYKGHGSGIQCLTAREKHRELYTGSSDGNVRSWDIESGQILKVFDGHHGAIVCMKVSVVVFYMFTITMKDDLQDYLVIRIFYSWCAIYNHIHYQLSTGVRNR